MPVWKIRDLFHDVPSRCPAGRRSWTPTAKTVIDVAKLGRLRFPDEGFSLPA